MTHPVPISAIKVGFRHRKDMGDIGALAASIEDVGLLQPIGITPSFDLVFGERRLEAFKELGRNKIPARFIDIEAIARGERAENMVRKDFTPGEAVAVWGQHGPGDQKSGEDPLDLIQRST